MARYCGLPAGNRLATHSKSGPATPHAAIGVRFKVLAVGIVQRQMMLIGHAVISHLKLVGLQPTRFAFVELGPRGLVIAIFRHEGQARFNATAAAPYPTRNTDRARHHPLSNPI